MRSLQILIPIAISAVSQAASADCTKKLVSYFETVNIGQNLKVVENELNLNKPEKTYMGSSEYQDRSFRYDNVEGCLLEIGLHQATDESDYEKGIFLINGDYRVIGGGMEYSKCCFNNNWSESYVGPIRK